MTTEDFKYNRYTDGVPDGSQDVYVDGSDALATNDRLVVSFLHVPTQKSVFFKAFITAFNETYNCDWTPETVYGRGDPIYQFKNTRRQITLTFIVPAATDGEAYENLGRVQALIQFLYPRYGEINSATTITQAPLVRMKVMNLLRNTNDAFSAQDMKYGDSPTKGEVLEPGSDKYENYKNIQLYQAHDGLLGVIENVTVNHSVEGETGAYVAGSSTILPKMLDIQVTFSAIHEHTMGWTATTDAIDVFGATDARMIEVKQKGGGKKKYHEHRLFPYGVALSTPMELASQLNQEGLSSTGDGDPPGPETPLSDAPTQQDAENSAASAEAAVPGGLPEGFTAHTNVMGVTIYVNEAGEQVSYMPRTNTSIIPD